MKQQRCEAVDDGRERDIGTGGRHHAQYILSDLLTSRGQLVRAHRVRVHELRHLDLVLVGICTEGGGGGGGGCITESEAEACNDNQEDIRI